VRLFLACGVLRVYRQFKEYPWSWLTNLANWRNCVPTAA
jgi:hypothetical protein